jgi:hypothetical protein
VDGEGARGHDPHALLPGLADEVVDVRAGREPGRVEPVEDLLDVLRVGRCTAVVLDQQLDAGLLAVLGQLAVAVDDPSDGRLIVRLRVAGVDPDRGRAERARRGTTA